MNVFYDLQGKMRKPLLLGELSSLINKETVSMFNLLMKITPTWNAMF
ncbi:uncharacterized protein METZ01_LOCUS408551 [marine metagenome]|uniref:Uncharacterized protein n=1 Tax=marine metagenome TaxID=408172 RepID=A0A382WA20_9ZZZZ